MFFEHSTAHVYLVTMTSGESDPLSPVNNRIAATVHHVLLNCLTPVRESYFGALFAEEVISESSISKDRAEWKKDKPSKSC